MFQCLVIKLVGLRVIHQPYFNLVCKKKCIIEKSQNLFEFHRCTEVVKIKCCTEFIWYFCQNCRRSLVDHLMSHIRLRLHGCRFDKGIIAEFFQTFHSCSEQTVKIFQLIFKLYQHSSPHHACVHYFWPLFSNCFYRQTCLIMFSHGFWVEIQSDSYFA